MDEELLVMLFLLRFKQQHNLPQVAILSKVTENVGFTFRGSGVPGGRPHETAGANVLMGEAKATEATLFLTYKPSEWEMGLLVNCQLAGICYTADNKIWTVRRGSQKNPPAGGYPAVVILPQLPAPLPQGAELKQWFMARPGRSNPSNILKSFEKDIVAAMDAVRPCSADPLNQTLPPFLRHLPVATGDCSCSPAFRDPILMKTAFALVGCSWSKGKTREAGGSYQRDNDLLEGNNIGALLVDTSGRIIAWSVNIAEKRITLHAECAMVRTFLCSVNPLPQNCTLYTTLEPCHMCAGILATFCPTWTVVFGQKDPSIDNNALERRVSNVTQRHLADSVAHQVEGAWRDFVASQTAQGQPGNGAPAAAGAPLVQQPRPVKKTQGTLDFLRSKEARAAFDRLQLLPVQVLDRLNALLSGARLDAVTGAFPTHSMQPGPAGESSVIGRLGLEVPGRFDRVNPATLGRGNHPRLSDPSLDRRVAFAPTINRAQPAVPPGMSPNALRMGLDLPAAQVARTPATTYSLASFQTTLTMTQQCVALLQQLETGGLIRSSQ